MVLGGGTVIVDSDTQFVSFVLNADAMPGRDLPSSILSAV